MLSVVCTTELWKVIKETINQCSQSYKPLIASQLVNTQWGLLQTYKETSLFTNKCTFGICAAAAGDDHDGGGCGDADNDDDDGDDGDDDDDEK